MASRYVVKVQYEGTLRRLALGEADLEFSKLESRTRDLFQIAPTASILLTYTDKDGDIVTMADDQDLNDALVLQAINPLRLSVTVTGTNKSSPATLPTQSGGSILDSLAGSQTSSSTVRPARSGGGGSIFDRFFTNLGRASSVVEEKPKTDEGESLEEGESLDVESNIEEAIGTNLASAFAALKEVPKTEEESSVDVEEEIVTNLARVFSALTEKPKTEGGESVDVKSKTEEASSEGESILSKTKDVSVEGEEIQSKTEEASGEGVEVVNKETDSVVVEESPPTVDVAEQAAPAVPDAKGPKAFSAAEEEIHFGISCDICDMVPIKGARYKSINRFDYDLCQPCFESTGSAPGDYVKMERSVNSFLPLDFMPIRGSVLRQMRRPGPQCTNNSCGGVPCTQKADGDSNVSPCSRDVDAATISPPEQSSEGAKKVVKHPGVKCDGCGMSPLVGPRLISLTKWNYDLCSGCFDKSGTDADQFHRVEQPENPFLPGKLYRSVSRPCVPLFGQYVWVWKEESDSETEQKADGGEETKAEESRPAQDGANVPPEFVKPGEVAKSKSETSDAPEGQEAVESEVSDASVVQEVVKDEFFDAKDVAVQGENPIVEVEVAAEAGTSTENVQDVPVAAHEDDLSTQEGLLAKLAAMGFSDEKLNADILEKNMFDLRKTLDDLCTAEDWNSIFEDLLEMGFDDATLNRRLMFKHNGNVKLVVKELVQMAKAVSTGKGVKQE